MCSPRYVVLLCVVLVSCFVYLYDSSTTIQSTAPSSSTAKSSASPPSVNDDFTVSSLSVTNKSSKSRNEEELVTKKSDTAKSPFSSSNSARGSSRRIFPPSFVNSVDAGGQIWEFDDDDTTSKSETNDGNTGIIIRSKSKTLSEITSEYASCKGTSNVSGIPNYKDVKNAAQSTPMWQYTETDVDQICKKRGTSRIKDPQKIPFLVYGALFGFEVDIVEIALFESIPIVDAFVLSESTVTHAKHSKPVVFRNLIKSRLKRFADLVAPEDFFDKASSSSSTTTVSSNNVNNDGVKDRRRRFKIFPRVFSSRKEKSGWDVERKQRREFQRILPLVFKHVIDENTNNNNEKVTAANRPVIIISQLDLDEIPSRETLLYWKFCEGAKLPLRVLWFRYQLECQQELSHSRFYRTIWKMDSISEKMPGVDLYGRRREVGQIKNDLETLPRTICETALYGQHDPSLAWHFSAFGGLLAVRRKNKHSPHSFVRREIIREDEIRGCVFNKQVRTNLPAEWWKCSDKTMAGSVFPKDKMIRTDLMPVALPHFVSENICMFTRMGWMT